MGHVYRCLKVADYLKKYGMEACFIMKDIEGGVRKVREKDYPIIKLPENIDIKKELNSLVNISAGQILITDIRGINNAYFAQISNCCSKTVYFDDLGQHDLAPDILINPAVVPSLRRFKRRHPSTLYLLGEKYFILGSGFQRKKSIKKAINKVLVSLGGADPANYTPYILKILEQTAPAFEVMLVLGPAFANFREIEDICRKAAKKIHVYKNVSNMGELMYEADIAVVSGGDTALELAYTGTPGLIAPTIQYEADTAAWLEAKRIFINLGDVRKKSEAESVKKIEEFWDDFSARKEFSGNAKRLIDGKGLLRIMHALDMQNN